MQPSIRQMAEGRRIFFVELDNRGLGELVHRLAIRPAAAAPLEQPPAILRGIGPGPDQLREALGRIYVLRFRRLPSGRGWRQGRFGDRRSRGRREGQRGSSRRGGLLSCIGRRSGSGRRGRRGSGRRCRFLRSRKRRCGRRRGRGFLRDRRRSRRRRGRRGNDSRWAWRNGGFDIRLVAGCPEEGCDRDEDDAPEQSP